MGNKNNKKQEIKYFPKIKEYFEQNTDKDECTVKPEKVK